MNDAESDPIDPRRRSLLRRISLLGSAAIFGPVLAGAARAQDDDGGDDDGGDDDGGDDDGGTSGDDDDDGGRVSGRDRRGPDGRTQRRRRRQPVQAPRRQPVAAAPPPPPELVALLPLGVGNDLVTAAGYNVLAEEPSPLATARLLRLGLPPGRSIETARAELAALFPGVIADENHVYRPDELLCTDGACAAHQIIGWSGWPSAYAPRIGMIDTGINVAHDALAGQRLEARQVGLADRAAAGRQHGTAIAAMLVGRMDSRVPGLLPYAELIAIEAFHQRGDGDQADAFALAAGVDVLVGRAVAVINMSFSGPDNAVLKRLVDLALAADIAVVAAAGNGGPGAKPAYPAAWPGVIAVTAVDAGLEPYRQANRGPYISLAAPGVNLWTAASVSGGRLRSGTSYAAPFVTAALAVERMRFASLPLPEVVASLLGCARDLGAPGADEIFGHGLLSAPGQCQASTADPYLTSGE